MNRAPILPPPPRRRPHWRGGIVLAAALALTACADLLPLLTAAAPVAEAGAKAYEVAVEQARQRAGVPASAPEIAALRGRVLALEKAEKAERIERAKERAADLRALTKLAREIAALRGELTDAIEVLEARRPDAGAAPIVDAGAPEGGS